MPGVGCGILRGGCLCSLIEDNLGDPNRPQALVFLRGDPAWFWMLLDIYPNLNFSGQVLCVFSLQSPAVTLFLPVPASLSLPFDWWKEPSPCRESPQVSSQQLSWFEGSPGIYIFKKISGDSNGQPAMGTRGLSQ